MDKSFRNDKKIACANAIALKIDVVRRIASIDEVTGSGDSGFTVQNLFSLGAAGAFASAGVVPSFYAELKSRGVEADPSIF